MQPYKKTQSSAVPHEYQEIQECQNFPDSLLSPQEEFQKLTTVNFTPEQNLLDLDSAVCSTSYTEFLLDRIVELEGPELVQEGFITSYKLYTIKTKKHGGKVYDTEVKRRYSDFAYLNHSIVEEYGGCILPRLPQKSVLTLVNWEGDSFRQNRLRRLKKYLNDLLRHNVLRTCPELRRFLFDDDKTTQFSNEKGEFTEKTSKIDSIKEYAKQYLGSYSQSQSKNEDMNLNGYERIVEELLRISHEIRNIVINTNRQIVLISSLLKTSSRVSLLEFLQEYDDLHGFIECCADAIKRTKTLRIEIAEMEEQYNTAKSKVKDNPRSNELDILNSKLSRNKQKSEKWTRLLLKQLDKHTADGRGMIQSYIKRFMKMKGEIYSE